MHRELSRSLPRQSIAQEGGSGRAAGEGPSSPRCVLCPALTFPALSPLPCPALPQVLLLENIATSVLVGPDQLPSLHALLAEAAATLQMEAPDLYVRQVGALWSCVVCTTVHCDLCCGVSRFACRVSCAVCKGWGGGMPAGWRLPVPTTQVPTTHCFAEPGAQCLHARHCWAQALCGGAHRAAGAADAHGSAGEGAAHGAAGRRGQKGGIGEAWWGVGACQQYSHNPSLHLG